MKKKNVKVGDKIKWDSVVLSGGGIIYGIIEEIHEDRNLAIIESCDSSYQMTHGIRFCFRLDKIQDGTIVVIPKKEEVVVKQCSCDIITLMNSGCKCGGK